VAPNESGDFGFLGSLTRYKVRQILGAFSVTQDATAFSLFNRDVSKAIAVLEKRINEEPDDAEAHFLLGRCYILTGNLSGTDARFKSAVRLDADYGFKIGGQYRRAGSEALARGNVDRALRSFGKAVGYQPSLRKEIAGECFEKGKSIVEAKAGKKGAVLERSEAQRIRRYLGIAYRIDPSYTGQCRKVLLDACKIKGDPKEQLKFLRATIKLSSGGQEKEITRVVKAVAKEFKKHKVKRSSVESELERLPKKYRIMFANVAWPPEYVVYGPGTYTIGPLKAGERTKKWIVIPTKYKAWKDRIPYKTYTKFKILAVTDQQRIRLKVWYP